MSYLFNRDFYLELAKGNVPKHSILTRLGHNSVVSTGTTPEDIWGAGGVDNRI